mgnify:CR=1 FL=1
MNGRAGVSSVVRRRTLSPAETEDMAKVYRHLWSDISSFEALHAAYLKARRGKRYDIETMRFGINLEIELFRLRDELESGAYCTGEYRRFDVYEPKRREVAALPFRDRVVQHALVAVLESIYEPRFIYDSYACRVGKGTHAGADRLTTFLRWAHQHWPQTYVLKMDVRKFFPSVDHARLKGILRRYVGCSRTLALCDGVIDSWSVGAGKGIPIGNLTSQLFANVYLHELDEFVKCELGWKMYVRYMDDAVFLGSNKVDLGVLRLTVEGFLHERLSLRLNPKTAIFPEAQGVDFLGYRIWRTHRLLRKSSVLRMRRKLKAFGRCYRAGEMTLADIRVGVMAWLGHASHANTYNLRKKMFDQFVIGRRIA